MTARRSRWLCSGRPILGIFLGVDGTCWSPSWVCFFQFRHTDNPSNRMNRLANQEVLRFILSMQGTVGQEPRDDQISNHLWATLKSGQVIPGYYFLQKEFELLTTTLFKTSYGHGVLRSPDPRFVAIQQFCERFPKLQASPIIKIVQQVRNESILRLFLKGP